MLMINFILILLLSILNQINCQTTTTLTTITSETTTTSTISTDTTSTTSTTISTSTTTPTTTSTTTSATTSAISSATTLTTTSFTTATTTSTSTLTTSATTSTTTAFSTATTTSTSATTTPTTTSGSSPSSTPHSPTRNPNQDFGSCICDLTVNICDVNCCCDSQCLAADFLAFNCTSTTNINQNKWCVPANELFIQNTPYILNSLGDLLCIDINNSLSMKYYQAPTTDGLALKEQYVNQLVKLKYPAIIQPPPISSIDLTQRSASSFTNKDYIWVITSNSYLNYLTLPIQIGTSCNNGPPVNYLLDKNSTCVVRATNIKNECNGQAKTLSLGYFIENIKITPNPDILVRNCTTTPVYTNCDKLLTIKLRFCKFGNSQPKECPNKQTILNPTLNNGICKNLVKKITYIFQYTNPIGLTNTFIDVEFFDDYDTTSTTAKQLTQSFNILYVPSTVSLTDFVIENKLSGNPGYIIGEPLVAGYFDGKIINVNQNRFTRFTVLQSGANGQCSNDDSIRIPIKFGLNMLTECRYEISLNPSDTVCNTLQNTIDNYIFSQSNRANVFAPFATSPRASWVTIANTVPNTVPVYSSVLGGVCTSVRTSVSIQIAYAYVGNINNPQAEIQYISYDWSETSNVNLRCSTQTCANNNRLKITTRVTFVDVSQLPYYTQSQVIKPKPTLPGDFFYPFGASNTSKFIDSKCLILVSLIYFICNLN